MPLTTTFAGDSARGEGEFNPGVSAPVKGSHIYYIPGTYTWTCPAGVTSVSAVAVGGGAGASGVNGSTVAGGNSTFTFNSGVTYGGGGGFRPTEYSGAGTGGLGTPIGTTPSGLPTNSYWSGQANIGLNGGRSINNGSPYGNSSTAAGCGAAGYGQASAYDGNPWPGGSDRISQYGFGVSGNLGVVSGTNNVGSGGGGGSTLYGTLVEAGTNYTGGAGLGGYANGGAGGTNSAGATAGSSGGTDIHGYGVGGAGDSGYSVTSSFKGKYTTTYYGGGGGGGAFGGGGALSQVNLVFSGYTSGGGGGLNYANNLAVTPGNSYTIVVGAGGAATNSNTTIGYAGGGGGGAGGVRIVWPGTTRQFPSTDVDTTTNESVN